MKKPVYYIFIAITAFLMVRPMMEVQYAQESRNFSALAVRGIPCRAFDASVTNPEAQTQKIVGKLAGLARETGVNLFFVDPGTVLYGNMPQIRRYWYISDYAYLEQLKIKNKPATAEEFNESSAVYSGDSDEYKIYMIADMEISSLTSLKNYEGSLLGQFFISSRQSRNIDIFLSRAEQETGELRLVPREEIFGAGTVYEKERPGIIREFFENTTEHLLALKTVNLAVFFLALVFVLMGVGADSRKIIIKKMNGYGDGAVFCDYLAIYIPPVFLIGTLVFPPAFFLLGGNMVLSFWLLYLKYEFALLAFSAAVSVCLLVSFSYILKLQPADLLKGKKSNGVMAVYGGIVKYVMLLVLIPALLAQASEAAVTYENHLERTRRREAFKDFYSFYSDSSAVGNSPMEVYGLFEGSGVLFSFLYGEIQDICAAGTVSVLNANSAVVNRHKFTSGGNTVEVPEGRQVLIFSHDIDLASLKNTYEYKESYLTKGNLNSAPAGDVEIVRLDPGQRYNFMECTAGATKQTSEENFIIRVNTDLPPSIGYLFFVKSSADQAKAVQNRLDQTFGSGVIVFSSYQDSMSLSDYLFKMTVERLAGEGIGLLLLVCALLLAAAQLYRSLFELLKKRLAVGYMHGRGIFAGMALPLLFSLGVNIVLSAAAWLRILKSRRSPYLEDYTLWQLAVLIAGLCALEALVWALTVRTLGKRRLEALKEI